MVCEGNCGAGLVAFDFLERVVDFDVLGTKETLLVCVENGWAVAWGLDRGVFFWGVKCPHWLGLGMGSGGGEWIFN